MAINRKHWKPPFAKFPSWLCPSCQGGTLVLNKDTFSFVETGPSQKEHAHEAWDPDWIDERFIGLLVCQNEECGQIVAIGGRTHHEEDFDWDGQEQNWAREFEPAFMTPAPPVFPVPEKCPKAVRHELKKAFSLYWFDTGSCANRLRAAAETLLTDRNIPRTMLNRKGKRERLSLHARIENFKQADPRSADYLLAIKWLGNVGSHVNVDELGRDDLLNGFELFEHLVELVYVQREKHLKKIAKSINSRKGRPTRHRSAVPWTNK